ncbi:hypothetical protein BT96DRAFT_922751 [Gymnopus androsaceus JB14]|uniref:F-box domain-containing protein n=1 Tax=Gymnopus androsaceus JB14 TaxID=1447944 RepID=A0A6A4HEM2_9AGAR|nr:hypothetical protein BT96DRAFT_922751 [Gymnopus androsaceus JB14]
MGKRATLMNRFASLLLDPQTASIGRFVKTLVFVSYDCTIKTTASILQSGKLPSLTKVEVHNGHFDSDFHVVGMHLGGMRTLEELWLEGASIRGPKHFQSFREMLASLTALRVFGLCGSFQVNAQDSRNMPLILPPSLRTLYLTGARIHESTFRFLARGLEISYPPMLHTVFVDSFRNDNDIPGPSILWSVLGLDTRVVLNVGDGKDRTSYFDPAVSIPGRLMQGLKTSQLTFYCSQSYSLVSYLTHIISHLPDSICKIGIDFNASAPDGPLDPVSDRGAWVYLDTALTKRYELGLLKCAWVRCTTRSHRGEGPSFVRRRTIDRTILDRVQTLLPLSEGVGILEVDRTNLLFEL